MNLDQLLAQCDTPDSKFVGNGVPPQDPPSILDLERSSECYPMELHMQDSCPSCGGFRMRLGDWVCWGVCYICAEAAQSVWPFRPGDRG